MPSSDYAPPVDKLFSLGSPFDFEIGNDEWRNYIELGFSAEDVPELIGLVEDERLRDEAAPENEFYAHIHAWRILGQLSAVAAAEPLTRLFATAGDSDWVTEDLPLAFALIGPAAIPALKAYMADHASDEAASPDIAPLALKQIAKRNPQARDECVAVMVEQLTDYASNIVILNSFIICELLDLKAVEAAPVIKAAHAAKRVDVSVNGTWRDVAKELGINPSKIPGPEPVEEPRPPLMPFFDSLLAQLAEPDDARNDTNRQDVDHERGIDLSEEPMFQSGPASKNQTKARAQRRAKRKQEKKSRKLNRKR